MDSCERKIYLVRHGADDETIRGGWSEHPLTDEGFAQAERLAEYAEWNLNVNQLYSSDLRRAMQTAEPVAQRLGLPIIPAPEFRETNNGELAGMKHELACQRYPGLYWNTLDWEQSYPGGESPKNFYERVKAGWEELQKQEGDTMLVTHGGVINVILSIISGLPYSNKRHRWKIKNAQIITLTYRNGVWSHDQ